MGDSHSGDVMSLVWEEDIDVFNINLPMEQRLTWHLKKLVAGFDDKPYTLGKGPYKVSLAWITREGERKYTARFYNKDNEKTFRSLKSAKAYALAITTLEQ
jgi:hypothetical protein